MAVPRGGTTHVLRRIGRLNWMHEFSTVVDQLYSELNKLADSGLIAVSAVGARCRKEYHITYAGRAEVRRWVTNPPKDPIFGSASLLKVFLLGEISLEQAHQHVVAMEARAAAEVKRLEVLRDAADCTDDIGGVYGRTALEYVLRMHAMRANWANQLASQMQRFGGARSRTIR